MRSLAQPRVTARAALAALATGAACWPRLAAWEDPPHAFWLMLTLLGLVSFVMWAFVFAWIPAYGGSRPFRARGMMSAWILATLGGAVSAAFASLRLDPTLRVLLPQDYPTTPEAWVTTTLFSLAFVQLFLCFAPFAFFVRLFRDSRLAVGAVVAFGAVLLAVQIDATKADVPTSFVVEMLVARVVFGGLSVLLFRNAGVLPVLWWALLVQARLLIGLGPG